MHYSDELRRGLFALVLLSGALAAPSCKTALETIAFEQERRVSGEWGFYLRPALPGLPQDIRLVEYMEANRRTIGEWTQTCRGLLDSSSAEIRNDTKCQILSYVALLNDNDTAFSRMDETIRGVLEATDQLEFGEVEIAEMTGACSWDFPFTNDVERLNCREKRTLAFIAVLTGILGRSYSEGTIDIELHKEAPSKHGFSQDILYRLEGGSSMQDTVDLNDGQPRAGITFSFSFEGLIPKYPAGTAVFEVRESFPLRIEGIDDNNFRLVLVLRDDQNDEGTMWRAYVCRRGVALQAIEAYPIRLKYDLPEE